MTRRPTEHLEEMAQVAFDELAQDVSIQGSLTARGFVPLLEWASDRAHAAAECLGPGIEVSDGATMVFSLLRRLLLGAVWAAEAGDADGLIGELNSCPRSVIDRELAAEALRRLPLDDDVDGNAEAIAAALRATSPEDAR